MPLGEINSNASIFEQFGVNTNQSRRQRADAKNFAEEVNKRLIAEGERENRTQLGEAEFLKLLTTELTHQDPLDPMKDREFIAQMAQMSSLEQLSRMNNSIGELVTSSKVGEAYSLIGREVSFYDELSDQVKEGIVNGLSFNGEQKNVILKVGLDEVRPENLLSINEPKNQEIKED